MIEGKRLVVVMPAYNAERTLRQTFKEIPWDWVDEVLLVDDHSEDGTVALARQLGIRTFVHAANRGYGGNQKTCFQQALQRGADIVVMVHPDRQHFPDLIPSLGSMIASGHYDLVLGSRMLGGSPLAGGMPLYKYLSNIGLTKFQNLLLGADLSEYHTGFRAFSRRLLVTLPLEENSDGFLFDNEILAQARFFGFRIGEVGCPTRYLPESSTIGWWQSLKYGLGVLRVSCAYRASWWGVFRSRIFCREGQRLDLKQCDCS